MKKTLLYDYFEMMPFNDYPVAKSNLPDPENLKPYPTITLTKKQVVDFRNDFLILHEVVAEVLGKVDFSLWDIMDWYKKQEVTNYGPNKEA